MQYCVAHSTLLYIMCRENKADYLLA